MKTFSISMPKLDRNLLRDFANKNLDITKTAINLIIRLTPYIDRDGRIHIDEEVIRKEMYCERQVFKRALNELMNTSYKGKNLLTHENGYYVSCFHISSNGENTYQKSLPILFTSDFLNLTLNQTRLFLYILTSNIHNQYNKVAIENLYDNKLHDSKHGLRVYDAYKRVSDDLMILNDKGLINIRIPRENASDLTLEASNHEHKKFFHLTCDFVNDRKGRTSKYNKRKHVIGLRVHPNVFSQESIINRASETELRIFADRYQLFHEDMRDETINYITGKKNDFMELFGQAGLEMYRHSLKKYFKEKHSDVLYYDLLEKAANYFSDFYLLEEVKKVIVAALKSAIGEGGPIAAAGYNLDETSIPKLVEYFIAYSSDEHKVIIDQDIQLIKNAHELMHPDSLGSEEPWTSLHESIETVYTRHGITLQQMIVKEFKNNEMIIPSEAVTKVNTRELIVSLAKKSLLSQQKELEEETKKIKQIVRFFKKKRLPFEYNLEKEQPMKPPLEHTKERPLYSWILEK
ncbi:hypothetical protein L1N85_17025 [Paenibacillus alkaliterrae]|uniref:hypothetical protein n=1 Tax=Paenibacillus alkaliterrae TaxID=320909 RepID=UPI001F16966C|nr:hypothetical protein [Paenibacillus alkaliterrae]MCF2940110.1 hypothetical protein [Paenibacillus alkaliterrae]